MSSTNQTRRRLAAVGGPPESMDDGPTTDGAMDDGPMDDRPTTDDA